MSAHPTEPVLAAAATAVDDVEGWLSPDQIVRLGTAATSVPDGGLIVEIGSFRGRSTIVLATCSAPAVRIVAIDPHAGNDRGPQEISGFAAAARSDREVFEANLEGAGVRQRVTHLSLFSHDACAEVAGPIDLLYVDGAHRYGPARDDVRDWGAKVAPGGTLLIHDSFSSVGVTAAIFRLLVCGRRFRYVGRSRSLAEYRADLPSGRRARLVNAACQVAQLPWFARNLALKLALSAGLGPLLRRLGRPVPEWPY